MFALDFALVAVLSYLLGSLPISRLVVSGDTERTQLAALSKVLIDILKGVAVVGTVANLSTEHAIVATYGVFLGHNFPILANGKVGTGLGTVLGAIVALDPSLGLVTLTAWIFGYYVFHSPVVAALLSAVSTPMTAFWLALPFTPLLLLPIAGIIIWRHMHKVSVLAENTVLPQQEQNPV